MERKVAIASVELFPDARYGERNAAVIDDMRGTDGVEEIYQCFAPRDLLVRVASDTISGLRDSLLKLGGVDGVRGVRTNLVTKSILCNDR